MSPDDLIARMMAEPTDPARSAALTEGLIDLITSLDAPFREQLGCLALVTVAVIQANSPDHLDRLTLLLYFTRMLANELKKETPNA